MLRMGAQGWLGGGGLDNDGRSPAGFQTLRHVSSVLKLEPREVLGYTAWTSRRVVGLGLELFY